MSVERHDTGDAVGAEAILNAINDIIVVVGDGNRVDYVNPAAEQFFDVSMAMLAGRQLTDLLPGDSVLLAVVDQARRTEAAVLESEVILEGPRIGSRLVSIRAGHLGDPSDHIVISLHERSIARQIDRQLTHRTSARSVSAMAQMLAHEVKNPLSGIRGAAQLLERNAGPDDRKLTELICGETDRIVRLVDRMDIFTNELPLEREPVNIHEVLHHVHEVANSGFGRHMRLVEAYDPSLPPVPGNRDQLVQVFLNLVKNAVEAAPKRGGEIVLKTAYNHGMRIAAAGSDRRINLPLKVTIRDNGDGIPSDVRQQIFDPFVSTKIGGTGLGLALVAKIVDDHGGIVDLDSAPGRTEFNVLLPLYRAASGGDQAATEVG